MGVEMLDNPFDNSDREVSDGKRFEISTIFSEVSAPRNRCKHEGNTSSQLSNVSSKDSWVTPNKCRDSLIFLNRFPLQFVSGRAP